MPNVHAINTAVYRLLADDAQLATLCTVYKGRKRPANAHNPSLTADVHRLEAGEGEGIWRCEVTVTVYADVLANRMPDHETLDTVSSRVREILRDAVPELEDAKALPLTEGESRSPDWSGTHDNETREELTFLLTFVDFH